ncbi:HD domain-containing protein [Aquihabitans sp. G128]|uniref:HD domain-containing protein n=1 Tax=Aquihabitans sp. G128 TaxID=2849779 RepID=UPI001C2239E2|nr:HD domain-containing protein [Aquihabitans sp. G128]QXC59205.1 HD domain-containing protein [Aquihabitans sp. G128]
MPAAPVDDVLALFDHWGRERYDEAVTQLDHALQTAAHAQEQGAAPALVAAALLHDVGHLLELRDGGAADGEVEADLAHEARGARWLAPVFGADVTGPIALHVAAKRYRCAVEPAYHAGLSPGSARSLVRQGGPMGPEEVARFERHPAHVDAVRLRGWDDAGKVTEGVAVPDLDAHRALLEQLARR